MSFVSGWELSSSRTFSRSLIPPSFISRGQYLLAADGENEELSLELSQMQTGDNLYVAIRGSRIQLNIYCMSRLCGSWLLSCRYSR